MSTFGRLAEAVTRRRSDELTLEEFGALLAKNSGYGPSTSGVTITDTKAMGLTAWYSGVRYLCEAVAFLPVDQFRRLPRNEREERATPPWLAKPDDGWTREMLLEAWMLSLLHRGFAAGFKLKNRLDQVTGMRFLHPDRVKTFPDEATGRRLYRIRVSAATWKVFSDDEVLWVPFMCMDGINPTSPIAYHRNSLGTVAAADELAGRLFSRGSFIRDYIQLSRAVPKEKREEFKAEIEEFHKGLTRAYETPVLSDGAKYETIALKADDAQLLESRQFGILEVARILRVPPHKLYELSRATWNNIEHQGIEASTDSIRPWAQRFEASINVDPALVVPGNFIEFNLEGLLRGDIKARFEAYHHGVNDGWMTLNEPRRRENYEPLAAMDVAYRPANMNVVDPTTGEIRIQGGNAREPKE